MEFTCFMIKGNKLDAREKKVILAYSRYKYGSVKDITYFTNKLYLCIKKNLPNLNPKKWVIVAPPFSRVPSSIIPVAKKISQRLHIPLVYSRVAKKGRRDIQYATIRSYRMRAKVRAQALPFIEEHVKIKNKNIIFIDDVFSSGATLATMRKLVINKYCALSFFGFGILKIPSKEPHFEEKINLHLVESNKLRSLTKILNNRKTIMNRHTIKSILMLKEKNFTYLLKHLSPGALIKFYKALQAYFGENYKHTRMLKIKAMVK